VRRGRWRLKVEGGGKHNVALYLGDALHELVAQCEVSYSPRGTGGKGPRGPQKKYQSQPSVFLLNNPSGTHCGYQLVAQNRQEPLKLGKRVVPSWWGANFTVFWGFTYNLSQTEIPTDLRKLLQKMIISTRTFLRSICTTR